MINPATGKLRELQLAELEMLHDVKMLCEKHGITYFLDYGNLLGAVRHGGFIPWDDDVDVTMPYADYIRFLEIAQVEFSDKYFIQITDTDKNFYRSYARVRKNNTTFVASFNLEWDIHHGVWLDIFPMVEINPGIEFKIKHFIIQLSNYFLMDNYFQVNAGEFEKKIGKAVCKIVTMFHKIPWETRVAMKNRLLKPILTAKNKKGLTIIWTAITEYYPADIYAGAAQLTFEDEEFDVPIQYRRKLEITYGDYMQLPPEDQRVGHGENAIIDLHNNYTCYTKTTTY